MADPAPRKRLAILVGGGPAPGINSVIGSATIEAINSGLDVIGIYDGFKWLAADDFDPARNTTELTITDVARIHFTGGSILRTARTSLLNAETLGRSPVVMPDPEKILRVIANLKKIGVQYLLTIGGDDTALSARFVSERSDGAIRVVHVPKTIDNDLPLPGDINTFGFSSARYWGTMIVKNLMADSLTTGRWYLVTAMGRNAGFLAMGIAKAAGATLCLIPEEFAQQITLARVVDVLEGSILKRRLMGRPDGVAVIAEGLAYRLGDRAELERLLGREVPVDAAGHPRLSEVPLGDMLKRELEIRAHARGEKLTLVTHELGYELRSADPTPADIAYCRDLGYGAIRMLLDNRNVVPHGAMVTLVGGNLVPMDFQTMVDPATNRTRIRMVNVNSLSYRVARAYQIRLERSDLDNEEMLAKLAHLAKLSPAEFRERYLNAATRLVDLESQPPAPGSSES
jgi:6-phosphofructokinase